MFISYLHGYLDPSSLSFIAQMLIGVFIGLGLAIKLYWQKTKLRFFNR